MTAEPEWLPTNAALELHWHESPHGTQLVLGSNGVAHLRVASPVRVCFPDRAVAVGDYREVERRDGGWLARGSVTGTDGTEVCVVDEWRASTSHSVALTRRATVTRAGSAPGIRLELRAETLADAPFDDWQLFVPGALYNRNDTDGDGHEDYLGTYVQEYRDDRLPTLAVLGFLPQAQLAVAASRSSAPQYDELVDEAQLLTRRVVQHTDIGSLGLAPDGEALQLRAAYPFSEERSFCLNTGGDGWAGYAPNEDGRELTVSYELHVSAAESLTSAIWDIVRHQLQRLGTTPPRLPFSRQAALKERLALTNRYYRQWETTTSGPRPAGYAVHFSPRTGETLGTLLEYGFSGAQTLLAYAGIQSGHRTGDEQSVERGRNVIDFFVARCQLPNGFSHGIYDVERERFVHWFTGILTPFQYAADAAELQRYLGTQMTEALLPVAQELRNLEGNYTRTMCESIYPILLAYRAEEDRGHIHDSWLAAGRRFGEFLLRTQNNDGSWYRAYGTAGDPLTSPAAWFGGTDVERKSGTIFPVEVLVTLAQITGEERWTTAARNAGDYIIKTYVSATRYVGGLNDTTHIKSVKTDSVGVMFVMRSLIKLYEHTCEPRYLAGARDAAQILASWIFLWDVPFPPDSLLARTGFCSTGWAVCDVIAAGSYIDNELLEFVGDLVKVAHAGADPELFDLAEIAEYGLHGALSMPGHMLGYAHPGIQCEGLLTSYWLSDPDTTEFSGAVSKRKGDDNDTCNGLINGQAAYAAFDLERTYGTSEFGDLRRRLFAAQEEAA